MRQCLYARCGCRRGHTTGLLEISWHRGTRGTIYSYTFNKFIRLGFLAKQFEATTLCETEYRFRMPAICSRFIHISLTANDAELCVRWLSELKEHCSILPACWELADIGRTRGTICGYTFNKFTRIRVFAITISSDHLVRNRLQIRNARNLFAFYPYITPHC